MKTSKVELWGGVECTTNRVGDLYFDQLNRNGHSKRIEDLELFQKLGFSSLRHAVLWEHVAPESLDRPDWSWADQSLQKLRQLSIKPIVGLLHHGSGPKYTSLVDPEFAEKFAHYAELFAARFPWVEAYTPVNEPLTTARFSGLYGFWYPHGRDDQTFLKILLNECRAIILAMKAIRKINPAAQLIQTEDFGFTQGTDRLSYQAEFDNHRRWLAFDLLSGRINNEHPLFDYLVKFGFTKREREWFQQNSCVPDVFGINHYVTSNRFLDHRLEMYPPHTHGGNGKDRYADVEAVRVLEARIISRKELLKSVWEKYQKPVAVTEVHLDCSRDDQLRWFQEIWDEAAQLRSEGVDLKAVTVWSLLGSFDWNTLVTQPNNYYEPGLFDIRSQPFRMTALARLISSLAKKEKFDHPLFRGRGWWQRDERSHYPPFVSEIKAARTGLHRPLLIFGKSGTLGNAFLKVCERRDLECVALSRQDADLSDIDSIQKQIQKYSPWAVINATGFVRVDDAEVQSEKCISVNVGGAVQLAKVCAEQNLPLVTFSSDLVFDGNNEEPYLESSNTRPISVYGCSKASAEEKIRVIHPNSLIVRTSTFFGPWDQYNFVYLMLKELKNGKAIKLPSEGRFTPTYVPDLVNVCLDLLIDNESGFWHLTNHGPTTWEEFAKLAAKHAGIEMFNYELLAPNELGWKAPRPKFCALESERGRLLPPLETSLIRYFRELTASFD